MRILGREKIKSLIFALVLLVLSGILIGCGNSSSQISVQDYNNQLIAYQSQALDALEVYLDGLDKSYDGRNLDQLYTELTAQIASLKTQAMAQEPRNDDASLKDAVLSYLSGLEIALENYEKPIVELVEGYTGALKSFYQEEKGKIDALTLSFAKKLVSLDEELTQKQAVFSHKHGYVLE